MCIRDRYEPALKTSFALLFDLVLIRIPQMIMMFQRWLEMVLIAWVGSAKAAECLVGCALQQIDAFDSEGLITWDERGACDPTTTGCAVEHPFDEIWSATSNFLCYDDLYFCSSAESVGIDGSSDCACRVCSHPRETGYYMTDYPIWTQVMCYIAVMELSLIHI